MMIKKNKHFYTIAIMYILLFLYGCNAADINNPSIKNLKENVKYNWEIDSLHFIGQRAYFHGIWGNAPDNIWAVGSNSADKNLIRFDGNRWSISQYLNYTNGNAIVIGTAIAGCPDGDFWIGTMKGEIWKMPFRIGPYISKLTVVDPVLNGVTHKCTDIYTKRFYVNSPTDIYAFGGVHTTDNMTFPFVAHYNGEKWETILQPQADLSYVEFMLVEKGEKDSKSYFLSALYYPNIILTSLRIYEFDGHSLKMCMEKPAYNPADYHFFKNDGHIFISNDWQFYGYSNGKFVPSLDFSNKGLSNLSIFGKSFSDFFCRVPEGIGYYNGDSIKTVLKMDCNFDIGECIYFDSDVFFRCFDKGGNFDFMIHGKKLKE